MHCFRAATSLAVLLVGLITWAPATAQVQLVNDGEARAVFVVSDTVKETSADAVAGLRRLGLRPVLLTGDNEHTAATVATTSPMSAVRRRRTETDGVRRAGIRGFGSTGGTGTAQAGDPASTPRFVGIRTPSRTTQR